MARQRFFIRDFESMSLEEVRQFNLQRTREFLDHVDLTYNANIVDSAIQIAASHRQSFSVVVDFGCGNAFFSKSLYKLNPSILLGVDINPVPDLENVDYVILTDGRSLAVQSSSVSAVFSFFVFHFPIPRTMLRELSRVLVPGGLLIANEFDAFGRQQLHSLSEFNLEEIDAHELQQKGLTDTVRCLRKMP